MAKIEKIKWKFNLIGSVLITGLELKKYVWSEKMNLLKIITN